MGSKAFAKIFTSFSQATRRDEPYFEGTMTSFIVEVPVFLIDMNKYTFSINLQKALSLKIDLSVSGPKSIIDIFITKPVLIARNK